MWETDVFLISWVSLIILICICVFLQTCEQAGEDLVSCEGQCCGMFHLHCLGLSFKPDDKLLCQECSSGEKLSLSQK